VLIAEFNIAENSYTKGDQHWRVTGLWERAKGMEVFDLPLCAIYTGSHVWDAIESAYGLALAMRRVLAADLSKPVILDAEGFIMDGWHRVAKALLEGHATIPAVRFSETPPPDFVGG